MDLIFINKLTAVIEMAAIAHQDQVRKGNQSPYITHPYTVGILLLGVNCSEDTIIAGILHDVIEDTNIVSKEISEVFGENVMRLIEGCSEPYKEKPWEERKKHTLNYLKRDAPLEVCQIICADKLHNILSIKKDLDDQGEKVWNIFKRGKEQQRWYYESIVDILGERIPDFPLYHQLKITVVNTFGN
ncbi:HD domain-containing protein [Peribacillus simplex]|uniref:HD domain-containing protein n=1 Tax=Peribacillus simplex TaxID=1478 RepID=UPI003D28C87C